MLNNVIKIASEQTDTMTTRQALSFGGSVTLLGVAIVFAALVCLIILTILYPKIAKFIIGKSTAIKDNKAAKKAAKLARKETVNVAANQTKTISESKSENIDDNALIAVITAAIAASLGTSSNGITIKSLRRSGANIPSWGLEGRNEQVYNRF
jgi:glutaconyl-CoA/methylmalonyl-CoA decarboxylase subunit delta